MKKISMELVFTLKFKIQNNNKIIMLFYHSKILYMNSQVLVHSWLCLKCKIIEANNIVLSF